MANKLHSLTGVWTNTYGMGSNIVTNLFCYIGTALSNSSGLVKFLKEDLDKPQVGKKDVKSKGNQWLEHYYANVVYHPKEIKKTNIIPKDMPLKKRKLKDIINKKESKVWKFFKDEKGFYKAQGCYAVWYHDTKAFERLEACKLTHSSYVVSMLHSLMKRGKDPLDLTVEEIDQMSVKASSMGQKFDTVAIAAYGAYNMYLSSKNTSAAKGNIGKNSKKGVPKTADDLIQGVNETTNGKGIARNFEKIGGYSQTVNDFNSLNPSNVKEIQTKYGTGYVGTLSDGTTVVARPGSATGGATLEINVSNSKVYKIRY